MKNSPGAFEVDMFPAEVDSPDHPYAAQFKEMLESVAREYDCKLLSFEIREGTVSFSFDSDVLTAEIVEILKENGNESKP
ncbi:MAG: hypothetical protein JRL30_13295 [Deltaproteobacteria bacterium]|nr:hypothetical protein [Deltaproteobacteria bacterium]